MGVLISFQDPATPADDSGAWTPLRTDVRQIGAQMAGQQIDLSNVNPADLQTPPEEVDAIVKAICRGYPGLPYWSAVALLEKWLLSLRTKGVPRSGDRA